MQKKKEYYENNKEKILEDCKEYRNENKECIQEYRKQHYQDNEEYIKKTQSNNNHYDNIEVTKIKMTEYADNHKEQEA